MSNVKGPTWFSPSGFAACRILVSLELVPLPVCSFLWQTSRDSGTSNTLVSLTQSRLHFHSFNPSGPPFREFLAWCQCQWLSFNMEEDSITPSAGIIPYSKAGTTGMTVPSLTTNLAPRNHICSSFDLLLLFWNRSFLLHKLKAYLGEVSPWRHPSLYSTSDQASL